MRIRPKQSFGQAVAKPQRLGPEYNPWWWNPSRPEAGRAPRWFADKLEAVDPTLELTWNKLTQRWQVWARKDRLQNPICRGWQLLFIHQDSDGSYLPLDERLLARLFSASADRWGNAKEYFRSVEREIERRREKQHAASLQDSIDRAMTVFDYSQIKNIGKGSKFATYHQ